MFTANLNDSLVAKGVSVLTALVLTFGVFPGAAFATSNGDTCGQKTTYTVDEDSDSFFSFDESNDRVQVDFNGNSDDRDQVIVTADTGYVLVSVEWASEGNTSSYTSVAVTNPTTVNTSGNSSSTRIDNVRVQVKKADCVDACGQQFTYTKNSIATGTNVHVDDTRVFIKTTDTGTSGNPDRITVDANSGYAIVSVKLELSNNSTSGWDYQGSVELTDFNPTGDTIEEYEVVVKTPNCAPVDTDNDTIPDTTDNCDAVANVNQLDSDNDGIGDVCDETPLPDACPNVTGNQQSGPCVDDACVAPFMWNTQNQTCDAPACPEGQIGSYPNCETPEPEVCPEGTEGVYPICLPISCPEGTVGVFPACVPLSCPEGTIGAFPICIPEPTDACPGDIGFQLTGPCESEDVCPSDEGIQTNTEECTQEVVDVCPNIDGMQSIIPEGMTLSESNCVSSNEGGGGSYSGGGTDPVDMCSNIEGSQEFVPEGYRFSQGECIAPQSSNSGSTDVPAAPAGAETPAVETPAGEVLGESCEPLLSSFMREGKENDAEEVKKLQSFLNADLGSTLDIDGVFGPSTTSAVKEFQVKYSSEILAPWLPFGLKNDKAATGYVYKTTLRWVNKLNCSALEIPMPQLP